MTNSSELPDKDLPPPESDDPFGLMSVTDDDPRDWYAAAMKAWDADGSPDDAILYLE